MSDSFSIESLIEGAIPPRVRRLIKLMQKALREHRMLEGCDRLIIGISGGKDSLTLALLLALTNRFYPGKLEIEAVQIDWQEHPMSEASEQQLVHFFNQIDLPYTILRKSMRIFAEKRPFSCYSCSRARRKIIFEYAKEKSVKAIAFGHHLDDLVETSLINLIHRGRFETMKPVSPFWDDLFRIIRPMVFIPEQKIIDLSTLLNYPILELDCPYKETNIRTEMKPLVKQLSEMEPHLKAHLYHAHFPELPVIKGH